MSDIVATAEHNRQKFIGGSDIAAILGVSPWKTPLDLYLDKIKPRVEGPAKKVFARGIRWESVVAEMLVEDLTSKGHKVEIVGSNKRYIDTTLLGANGLPFLAAEIDFEIKLDGEAETTNVELKTVHPFAAKMWGETGSDNAPIHYVAQVMHGLGVKPKPKAILAALFGADELRTYPIARDDETISALRSRAKYFWDDHVLAGIAPDPTNQNDLAKLYSSDPHRPALIADAELASYVMRLRAIDREIDARSAEADDLRFRIKRAMQDADELIMPNGKSAITWKERSGVSLAETDLKAEHPDVYKAFARKWTSRVFTLKSFDTKGL